MTQFYLCKAPSNIALLKYWGKSDPSLQWPASNSISMTLKNSCSSTKVSLASTDSFRFEGNEVTSGKAIEHIRYLKAELRCKTALCIESENSFPTACGIASSASGMAALTVAVVAAGLECQNFQELEAKGFPREKLAHLARMGSGSAGRSLWGGFVSWEKGTTASNQKLKKIPSHLALADTVVLFDTNEKEVSSSQGHRAAESSPLYQARIAAHQERYDLFVDYLNEDRAEKSDSLSRLGLLMEEEALQMHFIAMTGNPGIQYIQETTANFCSWLRGQRQHHGLKAWFTIDAGPNVHVLCKLSERAKLIKAIDGSPFAHYARLLDEVGDGPVLKVL